MKGIAKFVLRYRFPVLILMFALSGWFLFKAPGVKINLDPLANYPSDNPEFQHYMEVGELFHSNRTNVIILEFDNLFTPKALKVLSDVTSAVTQVQGVNTVMSLANLSDIRPEEGGVIAVRSYVDPQNIPTDSKVLGELKQRVLSSGMLAGSLVSEDGRAAMITVTLSDKANALQTARIIQEVVATTAKDFRYYLGGVAMTQLYLTEELSAGRMTTIIMWVLGLLLLALYLGLRSIFQVFMAVFSTVLVLLWTIGSMALWELELTLYTATAPLIIALFALAISILTFIGFKKQNGLDEKWWSKRLSRTGYAGGALFLIFLSIGFSANLVFRNLGIILAIGAVWATVINITVIPALWEIWPGKGRTKRSLDVANGAASFLLRHRFGFALLGIAFFFASLATIGRISNNPNPFKNFPDKAAPAKFDRAMQKYFGGSSVFIIDYQAKDARHPAVLEHMDLLGKKVRTIENVNFPQSIAGVIQLINASLNNEPGLPDSMAKINNIWFMLEGQPQVGMLLEKHLKRGILQGRISSSDSLTVRKALAGIQSQMSKQETVERVEVALNGLTQSETKAMIRIAAERIAKKVALDLRYHLRKRIDEKVLAQEIANLVLQRAGYLDSDNLLQDYIRYFKDPESDLLLDQNFDSTQTALALARIKNPNQTNVVGALKENIPEQYWKNDPEGLEFAAYSILAIAQLCNQRTCADKAVSLVEKLIGQDVDLHKHDMLLADLRGDLWAVNNQFYYISPEEYRVVFGHKPNESDVLVFDQQLTGFAKAVTSIDADMPFTYFKNMIAAAILLLAIFSVMARSKWLGFIALMSVLISAFLVLAMMVFMSIELDANALIYVLAACCLSVPFTVFVSQKLLDGKKAGRPLKDSIVALMKEEGRGIATTALAVGLGFAMMVFADLNVQRQIGFFVAFSALMTTLSSLFVLTAFLTLGAGKTNT